MAEKDYGDFVRSSGYAYGHFGKDIIADTAAHTGNWYALQMLQDTVFTAITDASLKSGSATARTYVAGFMYYGKISALTLASGSCIAFRALTGSGVR